MPAIKKSDSNNKTRIEAQKLSANLYHDAWEAFNKFKDNVITASCNPNQYYETPLDIFLKKQFHREHELSELSYTKAVGKAVIDILNHKLEENEKKELLEKLSLYLRDPEIMDWYDFIYGSGYYDPMYSFFTSKFWPYSDITDKEVHEYLWNTIFRLATDDTHKTLYQDAIRKDLIDLFVQATWIPYQSCSIPAKQTIEAIWYNHRDNSCIIKTCE